MKSNMKLLLGLVAGIAAVLLIFQNISEAAVWSVPVEEVIAKKQEYVGKTIRLLGQSVTKTIQQKPGTLEYRFEVIPRLPKPDETVSPYRDQIAPGASLSIYHNGIVPDTLWPANQEKAAAMGQMGAEVTITGTLNEEGVFVSKEIVAKCPSKYEEAEPKGNMRPQASR
jgi:cytochrome c-type biogenesis protein CcmE